MSLVVVLDLPNSCPCGIDLYSFNCTPQFRGFKSVPDGIHLFYCSSGNEIAGRCGVWFEARQDSIHGYRWDGGADLLVPIGQDDLLRMRASSEIVMYTSPYPSQANDNMDWPGLTEHVSVSLLSQVLGNQWLVWSEMATLEDPVHEDANTLRLTEIDLRKSWEDNSTPDQVTFHALDKSWALEQILKKSHHGKGIPLVGEVQFCFIMLLFLANHAGLESWKRILILLCSCREAILTRPKLYGETIKSLRLQLNFCPEDLLSDLITSESFLLPSLRMLRRHLHDVSSDSSVMMEYNALKNTILQRFDVDLDLSVAHGVVEIPAEDGGGFQHYERDDPDEETGEYAPAIVYS